VADAGRSGLSVVTSDAFVVAASPPEAVRVSLGVVRDSSVLGRALGLLAALLDGRPAAASTIV
jgi:hypothetical protein